MKSPAFQFYAADYLADEQVQLMTIEEEGCYIRLLSYCWREGSIPADENLIVRLCKGSNAFRAVIEQCFVVDPKSSSRLINKRLRIEARKQEEYRRAKQRAGEESGKSRRRKKFSAEHVFDSVRTKDEQKGTLQPSVFGLLSSDIKEPPIVPQGGPVAVPDQKPKKPKPTMTAEQRDWFTPWWNPYPRKDAKKQAEIAWGKTVHDKATADAALAGLMAQLPELLSRERSKIPHPGTWIAGLRWTDELPALAVPGTYPVRDGPLPKQKPFGELFLS